MNDIEFNKMFYPRNNDRVYQLALMFTKYGSAQTDVLEYMFFANNDAIVSGMNWLEFLEQFNSYFNYTLTWIKDLDQIENENDWFLHRSKIVSKFRLSREVDASKVLDKFKSEPRVISALRNGSILWNNFITNTYDTKYKPDPEITWELWKILRAIKNGVSPGVVVEDKHLKHFSKILNHRAKDEFCVNNRVNFEPKDKEDLSDMTKKIGMLIFRDGLKEKLSRNELVKKILKI